MRPFLTYDGVTAEVSAVRKMESWKSLPYDRRKLQTGKGSMFLTDKELFEFFQQDLDHDGDSGELLPIPTNQESGVIILTGILLFSPNFFANLIFSPI